MTCLTAPSTIPQIEAEYRRDKERWKDNPSFITPIEETVARLQKQIGWHEIHGAIRYFVLTLCDKSSSDFDGRYARQRFYKDEQERLIKSFTQMEQRAKELNAVADRYGYSAPKDATPEVKEAIKQHLSVFKFGFHTRGEFLERGISLGILQEAGATSAQRKSSSFRGFDGGYCSGPNGTAREGESVSTAGRPACQKKGHHIRAVGTGDQVPEGY
jgi:hypothetical protein